MESSSAFDNVSTRLRNAVHDHHIKTWDELAATPEETIRKWRGVGHKVIEEIKRHLRKRGLTFLAAPEKTRSSLVVSPQEIARRARVIIHKVLAAHMKEMQDAADLDPEADRVNASLAKYIKGFM